MSLQRIQSNMIGTGSVSTLKLALTGIVYTSNDTLTSANIFAPTTNVMQLCSNIVNANVIDLNNNAPVLNSNRTFGFFIDNYKREFNFLVGSFNFVYNEIDMRPVSNVARLTYSGSAGTDQTFVVPAGVNYIFVKMWGAGGGAGRAGGWSYGAHGGGGGHSRGIIPVYPGETLTIVVGRGGLTVCNSQSYGNGGFQPYMTQDPSRYSGQGGGYAGIFRGSPSSTTCLMAAGGGGGGGSSTSWTGIDGGAGGGRAGNMGEAPFSGQIGFAGYGSTLDSPELPLNAKLASVPVAGWAPSFGANSQGGPLVGGNSWSISYGGGGGAGFIGGGGGAHSTSPTMGGGGGGTGYIDPAVIHGNMYTGSKRYPAFFWDPDLELATRSGGTPQPHAYGGINTQNNQGSCEWSGGHAWVVIYY